MGVVDLSTSVRFPLVDGSRLRWLLRLLGIGPKDRCTVAKCFVDTFFVCECKNLLVIVPGIPDFQSGFSVCRKCRRTWHVERKGDEYLVTYRGPTTIGLGLAGVGGG